MKIRGSTPQIVISSDTYMVFHQSNNRLGFINPGLTLHCISYVLMMPLTCGWMIQTESSCLTVLWDLQGISPLHAPWGTARTGTGRHPVASWASLECMWHHKKKQRGINNPPEWWEGTSIMVHWCTFLLQEKMHITIRGSTIHSWIMGVLHETITSQTISTTRPPQL